jgi:Peptidase inhibitor family I36
MGRRLVAVAAVTAMAAALCVLAIGSSATAGSPSTCPKGKLCLWTGANYTDDRLLIGTRRLSNKISAAPGAFGDAVSSLKLRMPGTAILYDGADGGGQLRCFNQDSARKVPDLASLDWQFDNLASSSKIPKSTSPSACNEP